MAESTAHGAGGGRRQSSGTGPAAAARSWHHSSQTGAGFTQCCRQSPSHPWHPPEPHHMQAHNRRFVPRSLWEVQVAIPALSIRLQSSSRHRSLGKRCSHFSRLLLLAKPSFKTFSSWVPWETRACARCCTSRSGTPRKEMLWDSTALSKCSIFTTPALQTGKSSRTLPSISRPSLSPHLKKMVSYQNIYFQLLPI